MTKITKPKGRIMNIGFIGFGEAGSILAEGLLKAGVPSVSAYDSNPSFSARADQVGINPCTSLKELSECSEFIFSTVVTTQALNVAQEAVPYLKSTHCYLDLNSTSPDEKCKIAETVNASSADFVEAAVMASVGPLGIKVPMLLCGPAAGRVVDAFTPLGMDLEDFGPEYGRAAATKMFRSIVVKGLEALFGECVLASWRYGVTEQVLDYVGQGYPGLDWNALASNLMTRTAIHGERRAHEMVEVARTLTDMGIEPIMADAAAKRLSDWSKYNLKSRFAEAPPKSYHEVMQAIEDMQP
jgi:3-hydroxyisobutyrate dehydrogenase-like beta-hydroxyacid dehydrogenase